LQRHLLASLAKSNMSNPLEVPGTRICVLIHSHEIEICANVQGFKALGNWMSWLAESNPAEFYHFHLLWHLESEASRFEDDRSRGAKNVWFLRTPSTHPSNSAPLQDTKAVAFELTFQVLTETGLDELASAQEQEQEQGLIPSKYLKQEASYDVECG
jgi:hypothetical protein